ncbi:MarR family winged helix-turn-helix transcriptional regulator [Lichenicoccus sp.]|uniref:MarR family winged helix-turn-helix transcriptional regulator n=1 Tax=Lichenicoccus sp. TaxID=2781899 RepID=UPI003D0DC81A
MKPGKEPTAAREVILDMASSCLLARSRLIARVISSIHDQELRPFGVNSSQFSLLIVMHKLGPSSRADVARYYHQDRSTLTRNLKIMIKEGWIEEDRAAIKGRARPLLLSATGIDLLLRVKPAWERGQRQAKSILGTGGTDIIMEVADRILASAMK